MDTMVRAQLQQVISKPDPLWWGKHEPVSEVMSIALGAVDTWTEAISILGKGYVSAAYPFNTAINLRLTIDGVVVAENIDGGIFDVKTLWSYWNSTSNFPVTLGSTNIMGAIQAGGVTRQSYPYTGGASSFIVIPQELFFEEEMIMEVKRVAATTNVPCGFMGGALKND